MCVAPRPVASGSQCYDQKFYSIQEVKRAQAIHPRPGSAQEAGLHSS
jgi:hypothetical protein